MTFTGEIKFYFNRHASDGRVWCVEAAGAECAVRLVVVSGVSCYTKYEPQPVTEGPKRHDGPPSAWMETYGRLVIENGSATITPAI